MLMPGPQHRSTHGQCAGGADLSLFLQSGWLSSRTKARDTQALRHAGIVLKFMAIVRVCMLVQIVKRVQFLIFPRFGNFNVGQLSCMVPIPRDRLILFFLQTSKLRFRARVFQTCFSEKHSTPSYCPYKALGVNITRATLRV